MGILKNQPGCPCCPSGGHAGCGCPAVPGTLFGTSIYANELGGLTTISFTLTYDAGLGYWISPCIPTTDAAGCGASTGGGGFACNRVFSMLPGTCTLQTQPYVGAVIYSTVCTFPIGGGSATLAGTCTPFHRSFGTPGTNGYLLVTE